MAMNAKDRAPFLMSHTFLCYLGTVVYFFFPEYDKN